MSLEQCPHCRVLLTEREIELNECDACYQSLVISSPFNPFESKFSPEVYDMNDDRFYGNFTKDDEDNEINLNINFIPKDLD